VRCGDPGACGPNIAPAGVPGRSAGCHVSMAKKLRYMSKIAAIFFGTGNTQLSCTQPIGDLPMAYV
jgi:hypothetical protein